MRDPVAPGPAAGSGPRLLDPVFTQVVRDTGASGGMLYLLPPGERTLRLAVLLGAPPEIVTPWVRVSLDAPIPVADAVRERRLVWLGGREEMARRYPRPALVLPYSFVMAAAPVSTDVAVWGGLVLMWPGSHPSRPSPHERGLISAACRRMGLLLGHAAGTGRPMLPGPQPHVLTRPRTHTPGRGEALAAADFAERLPEGCCSLRLDGRIAFVDSTAAELLGADVDELLGALPWRALPWLHDPAFEDRYRDAVIGRRPTSFTALRPPDHWLSFQLYPDATGISVRILPALEHVEEAPPPREPRDGEGTEDAGGAGGVEGGAGGLPRSPAPATPSGVTALYHLMHLAATLTEAVGARDVVDRAADQLLPAFGAEGIMLFVAEHGRLRVVGHRGYGSEVADHFDGMRLTTGESPAARTLSTGVPAFFDSPGELERSYPGLAAWTGKGAWAFLPLIASGRPVGSLVLSHARPHAFAPDERAALTSIAGLIAQALDRARLFDVKDQLAHRLQAGLLPHTLPQVPGLDVASRYLPAGRGMGVGGDFYDLIRLGPASAGAAIGDVQGHNVTAAALMGQVRTAVHATAGAPPGEVLSRTNRLLTDLDPGLFTSCLYVHVDLARHTARLASAGHLPPVLRHPDGHTEVLDLPPGLLLGIDPTADYPTTEIALPPGAVLALYTDGLVEVPGTDLEDSIAEFAGHLEHAGHQHMRALADTLLRRAGRPAPRADDTALLLLSPHHGTGRPRRPPAPR
ncbi:SpoIIE family protein phosphatase [Streptomyces desertarenae]|uniref:SpoIIE family protein phosphatase n=1 Tax=Streptomyces desertarenae TaxID=2666184 RepID=A0ABW4PHE4_9ACTN